MTIIDNRQAYKPFEYEWAYQYWETQHQQHWLHTEVLNMSAAADDWNRNLTETEKNVIKNVLLGFTQIEGYIGGYWGQKVPVWFPKHEIALMARAFADTETIHTVAYNYLNDTLGLEEYDVFLVNTTAAAKLNNFINRTGDTLYDRALSLAVYSGFGEGVSLYSSFAILLSFSRRNLLKGVGEIVTFSVKDEHLHSCAGCDLYRTFTSEFPELLTSTNLEEEIIKAARLTVQLEFDFIEMVFNKVDIEGLREIAVKAFIEDRCNLKLQDLNIRPIFNPKPELVREIGDWFYLMTASENHADFFASRVTDYSKGVFNPSDINWDVVCERV